MSGIQAVAEFSGLQITIHHVNGLRWIQALDVGRALGYVKPHKIHDIYKRHADEFSDRDTCIPVLEVQGQRREVRLFSQSGAVLLSMFANTARAKDFRAWAKKVLVAEVQRQIDVEPVAQMPATIEGRLSNIEQNMAQLAGHMGQLVQVSLQQANKHQVMERYVGLLELNQRGTVKVTPEIKQEILTLYVQGMPQRDIARLTRISVPTVNQIVKGKYPENALTKVNPATEDLVQAALDRNLEEERQRVAQLQQGALATTSPAAQS